MTFNENKLKGVVALASTLILILMVFFASSYDVSSKYLQEITMEQALEIFESKSDAIIFFGYEACPYCQQAKPIVKDVARQTNTTVYYVKTRDEDKNLTYSEKQRKELTKYISEYMSENEDEQNKLWLYVPLLVKVENGTAIKGYEGIGNSKPKLNSKQSKQLTEKYSEIMS